MKTKLQQKIETLQALRNSLLSEETILWDEVNAVERELKFLGYELYGYQSTNPCAAEDAAVAMMESAARKGN